MHILCAARPPLRATFAVTRTGGHGCCVHPRCCQATVDVNARGAHTDPGAVAIDALPHSIALLLCTSAVMPASRKKHEQSVAAVHILCAASIHHGRIRSMLLSLYVECIRCAHSLCCQQAASRMPPREQHQKYKLSLPKNVALILHKQSFERIWLQMLSQSQDHHTTVTL